MAQPQKGDTKKPFVSDIQEIRRRARQHIEDGAVTGAYRADREQVIDLLNEALATEIVCVLRYRRHHFMAKGMNAQSVARFPEHAAEEQEHADRSPAHHAAGRRAQPQPAGSGHAQPLRIPRGGSLDDMMQEDLVAERVAIETTPRSSGTSATTIRPRGGSLRILADEEEHAEEMLNLLDRVGPTTSRSRQRDPAGGDCFASLARVSENRRFLIWSCIT